MLRPRGIRVDPGKNGRISVLYMGIFSPPEPSQCWELHPKDAQSLLDQLNKVLNPVKVTVKAEINDGNLE